jgi:MFS family permease
LGPSSYIGLPSYLYILLMGYGLTGFAQGFLYIPILPDALESFYVDNDLVEGASDAMDMKINDLAAGIYGAFYASGQIIAPTLGGALYDYLSYENTCNIMALIIASYTLIFFVFNVGFNIMGKERLIKEKMERLRNEILEDDEIENDEDIVDAVIEIREKR